jgi:hypothetical protein
MWNNYFEMNAINDVTEVSLIRTSSLSTLPTSNKRINMLTINLDLFPDLFNEFIRAGFWSLKSDTLLERYLLHLSHLIIRNNRNHLPLLLVYKHNLYSDRLLLFPHPTLDSQLNLFPSKFIFN